MKKIVFAVVLSLIAISAVPALAGWNDDRQGGPGSYNNNTSQPKAHGPSH